MTGKAGEGVLCGFLRANGVLNGFVISGKLDVLLTGACNHCSKQGKVGVGMANRPAGYD